MSSHIFLPTQHPEKSTCFSVLVLQFAVFSYVDKSAASILLIQRGYGHGKSLYLLKQNPLINFLPVFVHSPHLLRVQ